jgi:hypothetical protein
MTFIIKIKLQNAAKDEAVCVCVFTRQRGARVSVCLCLGEDDDEEETFAASFWPLASFIEWNRIFFSLFLTPPSIQRARERAVPKSADLAAFM